MKGFLILSALFAVSVARPEAPQTEYGPPPAPAPEQYLPPPPQPTKPQQHYGPPKPVYGPPKPVYGPPPVEKIITKNVYVHVPPIEPEPYLPPKQSVHLPVPKKHYKIIFIKAPTPPNPSLPEIPAQPQDEHKTLIYVLVKKPEEQQEISLPLPEPTEPSKPEVYFIKYKNAKKPAPQYGPPPSPQYGAPLKKHY